MNDQKPDKKSLARTAVYTPHSQLQNPYEFLKQTWQDILEGRELAYLMVKRDVLQKYRQSIMGVAWLLIPPIVTALIFVALHRQRILNIGETDIPYPVYVMIGTMLWQVISQSIAQPILSYQSAAPIMIRINISRAAPVMSGMGNIAFIGMIQYLGALGVVIFFGIPLTGTILLVPFAIIALIALGTGIGLILTPLGMLYHDVSESIVVVLRFMFFLTPVIYPPPTELPLSLVVDLNPIAPLLIGARDLMTIGTLSDPASYFFTVGLALVVLAFGWVTCRLSLPIIVERLGA